MNLIAGGLPQQVFAAGHQVVNFKNFSYDNQQADGLDQSQVVVLYNHGVVGDFFTLHVRTRYSRGTHRL